MIQRGRWNHIGCAELKKVTSMFFGNFACRKCNWNKVEQEKEIWEVGTVIEFAYIGDMVNAGGGCDAAVAVGTRCGLFRFMECGELLCGS